MSTGISSSDFVGLWSLSFADIDFINSKPAATRLGLAAQLKFFSARGFFAYVNTRMLQTVLTDPSWEGRSWNELLERRSLQLVNRVHDS